jgi:hypothetical protein
MGSYGGGGIGRDGEEWGWSVGVEGVLAEGGAAG